jgi:hypothetical protein
MIEQCLLYKKRQERWGFERKKLKIVLLKAKNGLLEQFLFTACGNGTICCL